MPWVYTLRLTEYRDAEAVQADWEDNIPGNAQVINDLGGVSISQRPTGAVGVIVSQRNNPEYSEMETFDYVESITESKEIPSRADSAFETPLKLGHGLVLTE